MKPSLVLTALALLGPAAFAADPDPQPSKPGANALGASVTGKATVTIDVNGKKETREIDLGNALPLQDIGTVTITTEPAPAHSPAQLRTWLGVVTDEPSEEVRAQLPIPNGTGLLVGSVVPESPAAKAGLEKNDVLLRLDDQILINHEQLRGLIGTKKDGDVIHVAYLRKGREATAEVKLGARAEDLPSGVMTLNKVITKGVIGEIQSALKPLVLESTIAVVKDGQLAWSNGGKAPPAANGQFRLFANEGQAGVNEAMIQLDKSLREAGASEQVIIQTKKAVADALAQMNKAVGKIGAPKSDFQKAFDEAKQAMERALRDYDAALKKAQPAPAPAPAPEKAP